MCNMPTQQYSQSNSFHLQKHILHDLYYIENMCVMLIMQHSHTFCVHLHIYIIYYDSCIFILLFKHAEYAKRYERVAAFPHTHTHTQNVLRYHHKLVHARIIKFDKLI